MSDTWGNYLESQNRTIKSLKSGLCGCWRCLGERDEVRVYMILCPECGNKRCPKASDHRLECTASNEPGQHGSVYGPAGSSAGSGSSS